MSDLSIVAVIPLYNGARWIEQAIASVLAQTLSPDEFVVVDDGSTDDGPAIVERLAREHPITLLRKSNGGQSSARNYGVAHSKSALIALLDQDDIWYPRHLELLSRPFRKDQSVPLGWVYSNYDLISEDGGMVCRDLLDDFSVEHPKRHLVRCLSEDMRILPAAALISRAAFDTVGGFDERLSGYEDDDLFLRIFLARWDNIYLPRSLACWRRHESNTTHSLKLTESRMIYMRKLIAGFPHLVQDHIAPRFAVRTLANCVTALERRDAEMFRLASADLKAVIALLPRKYRIPLSVALPFLRSQVLAPLVRAAGRRARRIVRPHDAGYRVAPAAQRYAVRNLA
jgi:glycosyltransferase involved in cell wall biosynthesis